MIQFRKQKREQEYLQFEKNLLNRLLQENAPTIHPKINKFTCDGSAGENNNQANQQSKPAGGGGSTSSPASALISPVNTNNNNINNNENNRVSNFNSPTQSWTVHPLASHDHHQQQPNISLSTSAPFASGDFAPGAAYFMQKQVTQQQQEPQQKTARTTSPSSAPFLFKKKTLREPLLIVCCGKRNKSPKQKRLNHFQRKSPKKRSNKNNSSFVLSQDEEDDEEDEEEEEEETDDETSSSFSSEAQDERDLEKILETSSDDDSSSEDERKNDPNNEDDDDSSNDDDDNHRNPFGMTFSPKQERKRRKMEQRYHIMKRRVDRKLRREVQTFVALPVRKPTAAEIKEAKNNSAALSNNNSNNKSNNTTNFQRSPYYQYQNTHTHHQHVPSSLDDEIIERSNTGTSSGAENNTNNNTNAYHVRVLSGASGGGGAPPQRENSDASFVEMNREQSSGTFSQNQNNNNNVLQKNASNNTYTSQESDQISSNVVRTPISFCQNVKRMFLKFLYFIFCCRQYEDFEDPNSMDYETIKLVVGPHYLLGEQRFEFLAPILALIDILFCILGCFGVEAIFTTKVEALETIEFVALLSYVLFADVYAIGACSKPSLLKTTASMVILIPKLFFVLIDASTFFVMSVWVSLFMLVLLATAKRGISWEIVDVEVLKQKKMK